MEKNNYLSIDGRLLQIFLAIYETNSVSRAAERFDLNQSTISYSLEKLRACLGDPLFVKVGRGITPTDRATMLVPHIKAQLAGLEGLISNPVFIPNLTDTRTTIAANVSELLPSFELLFRALKTAAPNMPLRLLDLGSRQNIAVFLDTAKADLVVSAKMRDYPVTLCAETLFSEKVVCYFDPETRGPITSLEDYYDANHASLDFGGKVISAVDQILDDHNRERKKRLQVSNVQALAQLVPGTDLVITMHEGFRHSVFSHLAYCQPPIEMPNIEFDMVWHRRVDHSDRSDWLRGITRRQMSMGFPS